MIDPIRNRAALGVVLVLSAGFLSGFLAAGGEPGVTEWSEEAVRMDLVTSSPEGVGPVAAAVEPRSASPETPTADLAGSWRSGAHQTTHCANSHRKIPSGEVGPRERVWSKRVQVARSLEARGEKGDFERALAICESVLASSAVDLHEEAFQQKSRIEAKLLGQG